MTTTLTAPPLGPLLERLFAEAAAPASAERRDAMGQLSREERGRLRTSTAEADYRKLFSLAKDTYMAVSPETAELLYMLAFTTGASSVVEFGCSFGISALHLAAAVRDNGGGQVITTEFEPSKAARARKNFEEAGLTDVIDLREGDAMQTLAHDLPEQIDLVLLDGAKSLYPAILELLEDHLRAGALVIADNSDNAPDYVRYVRSSENGYMSLPFGADVELSMRVT